ncbi:MAG: heme ABC exporter ATP-binding protein CcmA [Sphingomonadales bacterium]|nr:heme ABC exporter ATP-binding protein CcmA [Sphingomonadales bacterium]MDE2567590.1 heme ABC exporter ATP-binding protein CcmA [Sphingomonadales bacterium]
MQECRLSATEIACRRGDRILFRGLSFALGPGDALQLSGPNGTGKSSLMRILAGLLRPYAGQVEHEGRVALTDERLALDLHLPLEKALAFWGRVDGVVERVSALGLDDLLDVPVRYLSTGQKKRAALARVAASGAPVWLLDEPLNGLDANWSGVAQGMVEAHRARGGIVVVASHLPLALAGLCAIAIEAHAPVDMLP